MYLISLRTSRYRKLVVILCIFTIFFIFRLIYQVGFIPNNSKKKSIFNQIKDTSYNNHPYWIPDGEDSEILVSLPALNKHPKLDEAVKIWPYKGLSSDILRINRAIKDNRPLSCKDIVYSKDLTPVSIILGFYNEFIGVILRNLHNIVKTTPSKLINEVILVDDASTKFYLFAELEKEAKRLLGKKIRILRLTKRVGLDKAIKTGIESAVSDVVVIIDAHLETSPGWLQPLLEPIMTDKYTITAPIIEYNHWYFNKNETNEILDGRGVFDLELNYIELPRFKADSIKNFETPIVSKGMYVANKEMFSNIFNRRTISDVDGNLIELSLNTWLCGGRILRVPCSKLSHNYKDSAIHVPYIYDKKLKNKNLKRIILSWFDEYSKHYLNIISNKFRLVNVNENDIKRRKLKRRNKCKSFKWFIEHVAPDMAEAFIFEPTSNFKGMIQNNNDKNICVDVSKPEIGAVIGAINCTNLVLHRPSIFSQTIHEDIRLENKFLCFSNHDTVVYRFKEVALIGLQHCMPYMENQKFKYIEEEKQIRRTGTSFCLDININTKFVFLTNCDSKSMTQKWIWKHSN